MIAVDTNILIYAHRKEMPSHQEAGSCMRELFEASRQRAIPWPVAHEFLGIVTNRRTFYNATPMHRAWAQLEEWLRAPDVRLLAENSRHRESLRELLAAGGVAGPLVLDAKIAALCLAHGVSEFWTCDRDFSRFPKLRTRNPLIQP
jgi:hypothetical protein